MGGGNITISGGGTRVPGLANGTVLPPNKPFLAMVGDQKQGTNVEAPLETIKQALFEVMATSGNSNNQPIVIELDGRELGRAILKQGNKEAKRIGGKLVLA